MFVYTAAMAVEPASAPLGTELSGGGQALAAAYRENAALCQALESAVHKAEKFRRDAEMWQGAFHRAMALVRVLKKKREALPRETAENESLKSRSRRFARELFGCRSERQPATTGRRRGRRRGTPSHGRTPHPELSVREEESIPDGRTCPDCGKAWVSNGWKKTELVEVEVAAHVRRIRRKRLRPACACRPEKEAVGPAPARLFPNTRYGVSVWATVLAERYGLHRPLRSVCRALSQHGLVIAPGTLADAQRGFLRLFEPLDEEISRHLSEAPIVHGDETGWRIRELGEEDGGNARAWAWIARSADAVRIVILPSRSAEAALELFKGLGSPEQAAHLVCDRYSAYRKLARVMEGCIVLSYCWVHARRDFVNLETGYPNLARFAQKWLRHIATLYRLNARRLARPSNAVAQRRLARFAEAFFAKAKKARNELPEGKPQRVPLDSLLRHRDGLTVFVDNAAVPMDNNPAERGLRGIAISRKLSFGSHSVDGARLAGMLYSIFGTIEMAGVSPYRWLLGYLGACAHHRGPPPEDPAAWLPWGAGEERLRSWHPSLPQGP